MNTDADQGYDLDRPIGRPERSVSEANEWVGRLQVGILGDWDLFVRRLCVFHIVFVGSIQVLWLPSTVQRLIIKDLKAFRISPKTIKSPKAIKRCQCEWVVVFPLWGPARNRRFVWAGITPLPQEIRKSPQHSRHPDNRMMEQWWMW